MIKSIAIFILILGVYLISYACGNEYGYSASGEKIYSRYFYLTPNMLSFDKPSIKKRIHSLEKKIKTDTANYKVYSDLAWNYIKQGRTHKGFLILDSLIKIYPTEYNIVSNLGTAYELKGNIDSALKYIKLGYEINKNSHFGSEWIHIKILEAKQQLQKNPNWLKHHNIISLKELYKDKSPMNIMRINSHLMHQIKTRAPFSPAPNTILKYLLITLGDYNRKVGTYENAFLAYANAFDFSTGRKDRLLIKSKIDSLNKNRLSDLKKNIFSEMFYQQVMLYKIHPELLISGLNDFDALNNSVSAYDSILLSKSDSIRMLYLNNNTTIKKYQEKIKKLKNENKKSYSFWTPLIWFTAGCVVILLFNMLKKRS